jgi:hypothetical protein
MGFYVGAKGTKVLGSPCKVPGTLASFIQIWIFSTGLNGSLQYQILRKSVQLEASLTFKNRATYI